MAKIEYETLTDRAYAAIKRQLISGEFLQGHTLVIRTVAENYGISTTPVREALQRLVAERLLELQPNRSIIVPYLSLEKFSEFSRIRCALEGLAGELATANTDARHIADLRKIIRKIDVTIRTRNSREYVQLNQMLHFSVYERAKSPALMEMVQDLWCRVGPFFNELFEEPSYIEHANEGHLKILDALEKRDAAEVRRQVIDDIATAAEALTPRLRPPSKPVAASKALAPIAR